MCDMELFNLPVILLSKMFYKISFLLKNYLHTETEWKKERGKSVGTHIKSNNDYL